MAPTHATPSAREIQTQALIVGGGVGGVAAAIALARRGIACVITEPTDWLGGQLTNQAVPPDENRWVEDFGVTATYQALRNAVREWYRSHRRLTPEAAANPRLNPGNGWVSHLCAEPAVWHEVIRAWLAPYEASGRVKVLLEHSPIGAEVSGDRVQSVTFAARDGTKVVARAELILDATELGDLYPLAAIEHAIGAEHRNEYGEMHARTDASGRSDPMDQQAISWCFAMEHRPGENHVISRPARYDFWRAYVPKMDPPWTGPLFSWRIPSHDAPGWRELNMVPAPDEPKGGAWELWRYRRIRDAKIHAEPEKHPDVCLVNWVQMDYWLKPLLGVSPAEQQQALAEAREQSLCLFYWMQTEAPRHDGGTGYPGLKLAGETLGTADGFAKAAYIREPRRLLARTIVTERHIGTEQREAEGLGGDPASVDRPEWGQGELFPDTVGIGHYRLDLHPSTAGRNSIYVPAAPFRIPMGSLIPRRVRNVLAAGKGIGVTHITNSCYRMHHVEWNIGESAGTLAAFCLASKSEPHAVHEDPALVAEVQRELAASGVRIAWPWER
jgi:hypothetical protein